MYLLSPDHFAIIAWQHFQSQPDPCTFMTLIMSGRERFEIELFNE